MLREDRPTGARAGAAAWSCAAFSLTLAGFLLLLCGRPVGTADVWWHLKMGETYATHGVAPRPDPLLHTAPGPGEVHHEWLFGVAAYAVERAAGFTGLRLTHVLLVAAILWLVYSLVRAAGGSRAIAWVATSSFVVIAWWRLVQLRPDLVSIPAAFLYYRLLLERGEAPSWSRVALSGLLLVVWCNFHSLFMLGPLLLVAALCGLALRRVMRGEAWSAIDARLVRRLLAALAVGVLASALNPRGFEQHLTFLHFSEDAALYAIADEWTSFNPFRWRYYGISSSFSAWVVTNVLLAAFLIATLVGLASFLRRRSNALGDRKDVMLLGLGAASIVALLASIRFQWMLVFPILFVVHRSARLPAPAWSRWAPAGACALLLVAFSSDDVVGSLSDRMPPNASAYLATPYELEGYPVEATRFLLEAGLRGKLYNAYVDGGFLGFWLAPRLRTFIDGRTERYPRAVMDDYMAVKDGRGTRDGESFVDVLERRGVDVFVGVGLPVERLPGDVLPYTTAHLERTAGWILAFRTVDQAVYVRNNDRNRENLRRIERYYARRDIPFEADQGLDLAAVVRRHVGWASSRRVVPIDFREILSGAAATRVDRRFSALTQLGALYALLGLYEEQLDVDRKARSLRPRAKAPRRRIVWGLLRLGRTHQALEAAGQLRRLDPRDERSRRLERAVRARLGAGTSSPQPRRFPPLLTAAEARRLLARRFAPPLPLPRASRVDGHARIPHASRHPSGSG